MSIRKLRKNPHANPLVLESWAQHFMRDGFLVQGGQIRLLSLAIHDPKEYKRQIEFLKEEVRQAREERRGDFA